MTLKKLVFLLFLMCFMGTLHAQSHNYELGARVNSLISAGPTQLSLSLRGSMETGDVELILSPFQDRIFLTGLVTVNHDDVWVGNSAGSRKFAVYTGLGAHAGLANGEGLGVLLGVDGILGVEYKILDSPFKISTDIKPTYDLFTPDANRFNFWNTSITLRYLF
ncbi:MAG: hypothetical protein CMB32_04130 [Euryarchaeota archaeon]|nr:hypothetical protein [Euryarchaeota archaeon]|tara:strand:+ start:148 stop:639 length:492 start_codon:yes stop_codon:yes gene_type:complete